MVTALVMVLVRVWNYRGPPGAQPITGPFAAGLLLVIAGTAGLSRDELGLATPTPAAFAYAFGGALVLAMVYGLALLLAPSRELLRRAEPSPDPWRTAFVKIPLATVTFEEVAFRGVLWAAIDHDFGAGWATAISALLFGFWHVPPRRERVPPVLGVVVFTAVAGVVFALLRQAGGSLVVPVVIHWTANALGVISVMVARTRTEPPDR